MKKITLLLFLFVFSYGNSQELMNFYLSPISSTNVGSLTLHTTFFAYSGAGIVNYDYTIEENVVEFRLCYAVGSSTVITLDKQTFEIRMPIETGDYTFNITLYTDYNGQACDYENSTDSGSKNFSLPYNPTEKIEITDSAFESYLEYLNFGDDIFDNGYAYKHRTENIKSLFFSNSVFDMDGEIESLVSIKHFKSVKNIWCQNNSIMNLNLTHNIELEWLYCGGNPIDYLDVSNNEKLTWLWATNTNLSSLNVSNNLQLEQLRISGGSLTNLDLTNNINLLELNVGESQLNILDLSNNVMLTDLSISNNMISTIDLSNNNNLELLSISNSSLSNLDLTNNSLLERIDFIENEYLEILDISTLTNIITIFCHGNKIKEIDLSSSPSLFTAFFLDNNLNSLNIKNGNNENIDLLVTVGNPNLYCIEVDNETGPQPFGHVIDQQTEFSENCDEPEPFIEFENKNLETSDFYIYPNPVNNILSLKTNGQDFETIKIINLHGIIVKEVEVTNRIDVSSLASGVYFVSVSSEETTFTKKFIKL